MTTLPIMPLLAGALFLLVFAFGAWEADGFRSAARIFPFAVGVAGVALAFLDIILEIRQRHEPTEGPPSYRHAALHFGLIAVYLLLFTLIGFPLATGLYTFAFLLLTCRMEGKIEWIRSAILAVAAFAVAHALRLLVGGEF